MICNCITLYVVVLCNKIVLLSKDRTKFVFVCFFGLFCDMIDSMKIEIVKQKRKTIVLKIVDSKHSILKVPQNMSDKKIQEFLTSKTDWLNKNIQKLQQKEEFSSQFDFEKYIYLNGKFAMPVEDIVIGFDKMIPKAKHQCVVKYYQSMFEKLEHIAQKLSHETGLSYDAIKMTDSKRVWGSFNTKRLMKLNWKLVILPENLVEYVIYHELCHSIHMNHKPQFWQSLGTICPDYKKRKKELSKYSFVLQKNNL